MLNMAFTVMILQFAVPKYDADENIIGSRVYDAEIIIRNSEDGKKYLYDVLNVKKEPPAIPSTWKPMSGRISGSSFDSTLPQEPAVSITV